jgi:hypothetical protein
MGGECDIAVLTPALPESQKFVPPSTCYVSFTNTPSDQHLEIRFSSRSAGEGNRYTVLLRDKRTVTVFGHVLKYVQNASNQSDYGSYGILSVNDPQTEAELEALRRCGKRGQPFGGAEWVARTAKELGLELTLRSPGRPRKQDLPPGNHNQTTWPSQIPHIGSCSF